MADSGIFCAFSVDVEAFAESHAQSVRVPESLLEPHRMDSEIERNLDVTLECLSQFRVRGTFFFLGRIAQSAPHLVRRAAEAGHEIGCHSLHHLRVFRQTREQFREDLRAAKTALEDASGYAVIGFRAPDFSIGKNNLWALDELASSGFRYDSSIVPTRIHDVYGMADAPRTLFRWPNGLIEFPMPIMKVLGVSIPVGGGGYFRLLPLGWSRRFFERRNRAGVPAVFYIHPYEIGPETPQLSGLTLTRRFRHYVRLKNGRRRIDKLIQNVPFTSVKAVLTQAGFLQGRES